MLKFFDDGPGVGGRFARLVIVWGFWTLVGLFFSSQLYLIYENTATPISIPRALVWQMTGVYVFALSTPLVLWLARRYTIERSNWVRRTLVHSLAGVAVSVVWSVCHMLMDMHVGGLYAECDFTTFWRSILTKYVDKEILVYATIVAMSHAVRYYKRYREGELRASQAQLQALKMQLHPHFLFNTLNAISAIMHEDVAAADRMVVNLGGLLRASLKDVRAQEVPLRRELEVLDCYIEIEQVRFTGRLRVRKEIEPEALDAYVPSLLLLPLVENAVKHGIAPHTLDGEIAVAAAREGDMIRLSVRDDGPGVSGGKSSGGVGLANTKARLRHLYGDLHTFEPRNVRGGGFVVDVKFPFRKAPAGLIHEPAMLHPA